MTFSVIISCYNYADYVEAAIESVLAQTRPPLEVLVVDDGSRDDSAARIAACARRAPTVRLLRQANRGQLAAFVHALGQARGDYCAFLDADDWWEPGYLAGLAAILEHDAAIDSVSANLRYAGAREGLYWPAAADRRAGLSVLRAHARHAVLGAPTSGVTLRTRLARRIAAIPRALHADWVTEADSLLHLCASLFGALRYEWGGCRAVHYRVHAANRFAGATRDAAFVPRRQLRLARAAAWVAAEQGLDPTLYRHAHAEFATIETPSARELGAYLGLQWMAPEPAPLRVAKMGRILRQALRAR